MKIRRTLACSVALVSVCALSGCGALPGFGGSTTKVTVWLMKDSASDDFVQRFKRGFEKEHDGVELDVRIQEWTGIGQKITAALKGGDAPDVIEVGNTQVPQYAASGGLLDMTLESLRDWGSDDWLPGLAQPGNVDGMQYGIPWYAANRVVIYNKDLFGAAGITKPPKNRAEWLADTAKLNSGSTQGIYLAGQDWYTLAGFVWDEGGELAQEDTGDWKGDARQPRRAARHGVLQAAPGARPGPQERRRGDPAAGRRLRQGAGRADDRGARRGQGHPEGQPEARRQAGLLPDPGPHRRQAGRGLHRRLGPDHPAQDRAP